MAPPSPRSQKIREQLEEIRRRNRGRLSKHLVLRYAMAHRRTPLGRLFDWNVRRAAMKHWLDTAQSAIVRYTTIEVVTSTRVIKAVGYIRDPDLPPCVSGMVPLTQVEFDRKQATAIVVNELERIESAIQRARGIADVLSEQHPGLSGMLQRHLEEIVRMRQLLQVA